MKTVQANIQSVDTSSDLTDIACVKQDTKMMCLSEVWHPDNFATRWIMKNDTWLQLEGKNKVEDESGLCSVDTSSDLTDIACVKQDIEMMCLSEIWHPDNFAMRWIMTNDTWL